MISEDNRTILMELAKAQEDELCDLLHMIEEDHAVPNESWVQIENQSKRMFHLLRLMRDEIYYG